MRAYPWWVFDPDDLVAGKDRRRLTVSVCLPARNEGSTVGGIVGVVAGLVKIGLVDELVVVDDSSTDDTASVAAEAGATVVPITSILPDEAPGAGKGNVIWRSLAATTGDVVCWVDADIRNFGPHFVTGVLGPLLTDPSVSFVKGHYRRPIDGSPTGGGRVSELVARPLLSRFFPELAEFAQPLAGEYAGRRELLTSIPMVEGWGVEIAMLIDVWRAIGTGGMAQVDLGVREHRNRPLDELSTSAMAILNTVLERAGIGGNADLLRVAGEEGVVGIPAPCAERPPMASVLGQERCPLHVP